MNDDEEDQAERRPGTMLDEAPSLLDEKRERERLSRMIAFQEG